MEKDKLTEAQRDYRRQMMLTDENYYNEHKNDPEYNEFIKYNKNKKTKKWIIISIFLFILLFEFIKFLNIDIDEISNNITINTYNKKHEIFGEYITKYNDNNIILTSDILIKRYFTDTDKANIINDINNEIIYINSLINELENNTPNNLMTEINIYNKIYLKQLKKVYEALVTNSFEQNYQTLQVEINLTTEHYNNLRNELVKLADKINMKYTYLNDDTINFEWQTYNK